MVVDHFGGEVESFVEDDVILGRFVLGCNGDRFAS